MENGAHQFIEIIIAGISIGSVYALMGMGMALVYGVLRVFNFAYGSFYTWGAYIGWVIFAMFPSISYPVVIILVFGAMFCIGFITEKLTIHPLINKPNWDNTTMMSTLGLAILLDNLSLVVFGPDGKSLPPFLKGHVQIAYIVVSTHNIIMFLSAMAIVVILTLFINKTRLGLSMQAVSQDQTGARMVGVPITLISGYTFAISTGLVGLSGIILSPKYFITPLGGWTILVKAWVITAFGGMGSTRGAFYAAYILGLLEAIVAWQFGYMWVMVFWFSMVLSILAIKPAGLLGKWG